MAVRNRTESELKAVSISQVKPHFMPVRRAAPADGLDAATPHHRAWRALIDCMVPQWNVSGDKVRQAEAELFKTHPILSQLPKHQVGVETLAARIAELQVCSGLPVMAGAAAVGSWHRGDGSDINGTDGGPGEGEGAKATRRRCCSSSFVMFFFFFSSSSAAPSSSSSPL